MDVDVSAGNMPTRCSDPSTARSFGGRWLLIWKSRRLLGKSVASIGDGGRMAPLPIHPRPFHSAEIRHWVDRDNLSVLG